MCGTGALACVQGKNHSRGRLCHIFDFEREFNELNPVLLIKSAVGKFVVEALSFLVEMFPAEIAPTVVLPFAVHEEGIHFDKSEIFTCAMVIAAGFSRTLRFGCFHYPTMGDHENLRTISRGVAIRGTLTSAA